MWTCESMRKTMGKSHWCPRYMSGRRNRERPWVTPIGVPNIRLGRRTMYNNHGQTPLVFPLSWVDGIEKDRGLPPSVSPMRDWVDRLYNDHGSLPLVSPLSWVDGFEKEHGLPPSVSPICDWVDGLCICV